jgi:NADH dehydrogenase (ubiquinone) Fe-S protein 4
MLNRILLNTAAALRSAVVLRSQASRCCVMTSETRRYMSSTCASSANISPHLLSRNWTTSSRPVRSVDPSGDFTDGPAKSRDDIAHVPENLRNKKGLVSGVPDNVLQKRVNIYFPAKTASQHGLSGRKWKAEFTHTGDKWQNPLMGWTSSNNTEQQINVIMSFESKQEAIDWCEAQGVEYDVHEPLSKKKRVKSYADNFAASKYGIVPPKRG